MNPTRSTMLAMLARRDLSRCAASHAPSAERYNQVSRLTSSSGARRCDCGDCEVPLLRHRCRRSRTSRRCSSSTRPMRTRTSTAAPRTTVSARTTRRSRTTPGHWTLTGRSQLRPRAQRTRRDCGGAVTLSGTDLGATVPCPLRPVRAGRGTSTHSSVARAHAQAGSGTCAAIAHMEASRAAAWF